MSSDLVWFRHMDTVLEALFDAGCSKAEATAVIEMLKPIHTRLLQPTQFSGTCEEVCNGLKAWAFDHFGHLVNEIIVREVELTRLRKERKA